ncbi:conserved hypothetical protein, secreted [Rhodopirellula baltica WH47]|uniref:Uncharacterized protein n=1 Tax=Rhodopirellula baltica WH47 TaxID=991778 RepID=F2AMZ8_RHOBT|nr:conserved hypothetical protein, secreted [Rhodopirellula baltica WH47]
MMRFGGRVRFNLVGWLCVVGAGNACEASAQEATAAIKVTPEVSLDDGALLARIREAFVVEGAVMMTDYKETIPKSGGSLSWSRSRAGSF